MNTIKAFQDWFASCCNGDWEHTGGIQLSSLDNPGWDLDIELDGTALERREFTSVVKERSNDDWINCQKKGTKFKGRGGPGNLEEILAIFLGWASTKEL